MKATFCLIGIGICFVGITLMGFLFYGLNKVGFEWKFDWKPEISSVKKECNLCEMLEELSKIYKEKKSIKLEELFKIYEEKK